VPFQETSYVLKPKELVSVITEALKDPDPGVQRGALEALLKLGPASRPAVPGLLAVLQDTEVVAINRQRAAEVVGRIGPGAREAVPALVTLAEDDEPELRQAALAALAQVEKDAAIAVPVLRQAFKDRELAVVLDAIQALEH
jgi:HEAT repeat protein